MVPRYASQGPLFADGRMGDAATKHKKCLEEPADREPSLHVPFRGRPNGRHGKTGAKAEATVDEEDELR